MYRLLLFLTSSLASVSSQDIGTLKAQLPPCIQPCLATVIGNGCGNPTDWACGCSLTDFSLYNNFGCLVGVEECTSQEVIGSHYLIAQICALEKQSPSAGTAAPRTTGSTKSAAVSGSNPVTGTGTPVKTSVTTSTSQSLAPTPSNGRPQSAANHISSFTLLRSMMKAVYCATGAVWMLSSLMLF